MIDTTDPTAIELALTYMPRQSIINSINLEDGEEKLERVVRSRIEFRARQWLSDASMRTGWRRKAFTRERSWRSRSDHTGR